MKTLMDEKKTPLCLIEDANDQSKLKMNEEIAACNNLLTNHIKYITTAKESLSTTVEEANLKVKEEINKQQEILDALRDKVLNEVKERSTKDMANLDAELKKCFDLQEKLNCNVDGIPIIGPSFLSKVRNDVAQLNLKYSTPIVKKTVITQTDILAVDYKEQSFDDEDIYSVPISSPAPEQDAIISSTNCPEPLPGRPSDDNVKTGLSDDNAKQSRSDNDTKTIPSDGNRKEQQSDDYTARRSRSRRPEIVLEASDLPEIFGGGSFIVNDNLVNRPDENGDTPDIIFGASDAARIAGWPKHDEGPIALKNIVTNEYTLNSPGIRAIAYGHNIGLLAIKNAELRAYAHRGKKMFSASWRNHEGPLAVMLIRSSNFVVEPKFEDRRFIFKLTRLSKEPPFKSITLRSPATERPEHLSCAGQFIMYTYTKGGMVSVECQAYTMYWPGMFADNPDSITMIPDERWTHQVPLGGVRSICVAHRPNPYAHIWEPFAVCASTFLRQRADRNAPALVALNEEPEALWKVTFNQLDNNAPSFDLIDMVFAFGEIYILNKIGNKSYLYVVTVDGEKIGMVFLDGQPLMIHGGRRLAIDRQHGVLFISADHTIHAFSIKDARIPDPVEADVKCSRKLFADQAAGTPYETW